VMIDRGRPYGQHFAQPPPTSCLWE
jgi:hypothetical protein